MRDPNPARLMNERAAWKDGGDRREPRASLSRSIFALVDDRDGLLGRDARRRFLP